jgi:anti-sigma B factor antagonist
MSVTIAKRGKTVVVGVAGQLVVSNRLELKKAILEELERGERQFHVDLRDTGYIDSSGLGVLISLQRRIHEHQGELRLVNLNDDVKTVFELTKLDSVFQLE